MRLAIAMLLCLSIIGLGAGVARANENEAANALYVEAILEMERAMALESANERLRVLEQVAVLIDRIVHEHPGSDLAVMLVTKRHPKAVADLQALDRFLELAHIEREIEVAQRAARVAGCLDDPSPLCLGDALRHRLAQTNLEETLDDYQRENVDLMDALAAWHEGGLEAALQVVRDREIQGVSVVFALVAANRIPLAEAFVEAFDGNYGSDYDDNPIIREHAITTTKSMVNEVYDTVAMQDLLEACVKMTLDLPPWEAERVLLAKKALCGPDLDVQKLLELYALLGDEPEPDRVDFGWNLATAARERGDIPAWSAFAFAVEEPNIEDTQAAWWLIDAAVMLSAATLSPPG